MTVKRVQKTPANGSLAFDHGDPTMIAGANLPTKKKREILLKWLEEAQKSKTRRERIDAINIALAHVDQVSADHA